MRYGAYRWLSIFTKPYLPCQVTTREGVWANGGFAFFYDDPSFDCVFKLSKVNAAC